MVGGTIRAVLGIQPLFHLEHAMQIIVEATALLELDSTECAKLPALFLHAFLGSEITLAKESREQHPGLENLEKINSLQPIEVGITHQDCRQRRTRIAFLHRIQGGRDPFGHTLVSVNTKNRVSTIINARQREGGGNGRPVAAVLCGASSDDICNRDKGSRLDLRERALYIIGAKQLKRGTW